MYKHNSCLRQENRITCDTLLPIPALSGFAFNVLGFKRKKPKKRDKIKEICRYSQHHNVSKLFFVKMAWVLLEVRLLGVVQFFFCVLRTQINKPGDNTTKPIYLKSLNGSP